MDSVRDNSHLMKVRRDSPLARALLEGTDMAKVNTDKKLPEGVEALPKAIAVISSGVLLILQPNFDIKAGSVVTVDPRISGVQQVGTPRVNPDEGATD